MDRGSGLAPYQQRQMAQLATSSDYAVCRGKRGAPEHRLCTCGERRVETTEHAVLECTRYEGLRGPLVAVMRDHAAAVRDEHGYAASPSEILRWAIDDYSPGPVVPSAGTEASLARYRDALLTFHRESKRVRYAQRADAAPQHPRAL